MIAYKTLFLKTIAFFWHFHRTLLKYTSRLKVVAQILPRSFYNLNLLLFDPRILTWSCAPGYACIAYAAAPYQRFFNPAYLLDIVSIMREWPSFKLLNFTFFKIIFRDKKNDFIISDPKQSPILYFCSCFWTSESSLLIWLFRPLHLCASQLLLLKRKHRVKFLKTFEFGAQRG